MLLMGEEKELEIYIHIPFCVRKCNYCDFLSFACDEDTQNRYIKALLKEIEWWGKNISKERNVISVFIGGGTPSILASAGMLKIMEALKKAFNISDDAEITIECNPGTLSEEKLRAYKSAGINRISMGLQSADDNELKMLGRIHTYEEFEKNYKMAEELGFDNISIDLISGIPGQKIENFEKTLRKVIRLKPKHISAYGLIIEPGTPMYDVYEEKNCDSSYLQSFMDEEGDIKALPDEDEERNIYHRTIEILSSYGYHQYEISNYAMDGYESIHNAGYWIRREYLGLGLGASSMISNIRWKNTNEMKEYLDASLCKDTLLEISYDYLSSEPGIIREVEALDKENQMSEEMFLGLRMNKGVNVIAFSDKYMISPLDKWKEWINKMTEDGLLEITEDLYIRLTDSGRDLANYVMSEFV